MRPSSKDICLVFFASYFHNFFFATSIYLPCARLNLKRKKEKKLVEMKGRIFRNSLHYGILPGMGEKKLEFWHITQLSYILKKHESVKGNKGSIKLGYEMVLCEGLISFFFPAINQLYTGTKTVALRALLNRDFP